MRTVPAFLRRPIAVLSALLLALPLMSACAAGRPTSADGRPVVLTTFTVIVDIARVVAGDHLDVRSITKPSLLSVIWTLEATMSPL